MTDRERLQRAMEYLNAFISLETVMLKRGDRGSELLDSAKQFFDETVMHLRRMRYEKENPE